MFAEVHAASPVRAIPVQYKSDVEEYGGVGSEWFVRFITDNRSRRFPGIVDKTTGSWKGNSGSAQAASMHFDSQFQFPHGDPFPDFAYSLFDCLFRQFRGAAQNSNFMLILDHSGLVEKVPSRNQLSGAGCGLNGLKDIPFHLPSESYLSCNRSNQTGQETVQISRFLRLNERLSSCRGFRFEDI